MFQTNGNKQTNWEPHSNKFANQIVGGPGQKDGQAHHPIAHDSLGKVLKGGRTQFADRSFGTKVGGATHEAASIPRSKGHNAASNDIARQGNGPAFEQFTIVHQILIARRCHCRRVSSKELATRGQNEQKIDGKEGRKRHFDQSGVGRSNTRNVSRNTEGQQTTKANITSSHDGLVENLAFGHFRIGSTLFSKGNVRIFWRLDGTGVNGLGKIQ
mmetsp:Transcript_12937/g.26843  ORF Transcript_12937/g.26843 Transcript_12937/m.26843 type:complete len:214 (-) Transcript_12937:392-1033(-)